MTDTQIQPEMHTQTQTHAQSRTQTLTFQQDIEARMPVIQDLFSRVLETFGGDGEAGITAICEKLGVHRKLAWQIRNVAYSPDPFRAVRFMPSRAGVEALVSALSSRGMPADLAGALRDAAGSFEELIHTHAGDRTSLEMLVESCSPTSVDDEVDIKWREKAFQGNSFIWGVQARTQLSLSLLNFSKDKPDWFDLAQVRGLIGLKRVRPNVHWLVGQSVILDGQTPRESPKRIPLDVDAASRMEGVPIMPEFSSAPVPQLRRRKTEDGMINDELLPAPVGTVGQQTIVTGEIIRELSPVYATTENRRALFGAVVRTPCEVFVYDHFVHRDLFPAVERELCVFSELNSQVTQSDDDLLPVPERIEHVGRGISVARMPVVSGYTDMLRSIFAKLDWNADEFELYRIRMVYAPMPTTVVIRHPFPMKNNRKKNTPRKATQS